MFSLQTAKKCLLTIIFASVSVQSFATDVTVPAPQTAAPAAVTISGSRFAELTTTQAIVLAILALPTFYFFTKEPCNKPARITCEEARELFGSPTALMAAIKENPQEVFAKLWYFMDDVVIGRAYESSSLKADKESGKVVVKEGGKPQGVIGHIHAYLKPLKNATFGLVTAKLLMDAVSKGLDKMDQKDLGILLVLGGVIANQ